ncbi:trihelix transcription factor DF1-like isoform X2 [Rhodamnia argentea]|uniref:Trihelix transcription factor DF1-like isoform X2 n=1 Tax=Rhodamnia argentea TaxID=178133 RepID=A0ABM3H297_9MYRT|nr:trihelix transcription factor DF1-like isoform X2 [Rhodamnia argentea]
MLGETPGVPGASGDVAAAAAAEVSSFAPNSGEEDGGSRRREKGGGNRWPRQETLALLKVRSDMDVAFRDSSAKGPLWEDVSRKLSELGYHRSAKKCKEKFENVYKYHKRTKDGRTGKHEGKTYRFFDQLEAFENHTLLQSPQPPKPPAPAAAQPPAMQAVVRPQIIPNVPTAAVPSSTTHTDNNHSNNIGAGLHGEPASNSTSSSTFSDEGLPRGGGGPNKRKRRWREFFERVTKDVLDKQEELHRNFLETMEKRERERAARDEAWWMHEKARITREHEILAQERLATEAKDAAVMSFLQKIAEQQSRRSSPPQNNNPLPQQLVAVPIPAAPKPSAPQQPPLAAALPSQIRSIEVPNADNGVHFATTGGGRVASSSRWPKVEVEALIRLRTNLEVKYQENGPKGPLWEDISTAMRRIGYERSAKRCKEKWENINKYFKKVKESNKKRRDDSKTCPYFEQLDEIYREKTSKSRDPSSSTLFPCTTQFSPVINPTAPLMVAPEQQWPPPPPPLQQQQQQQQQEMDEMEGDRIGENQEDEDDDEDEDDRSIDREEGEDEDGDEDGREFEIVPSKPSSVGAAE